MAQGTGKTRTSEYDIEYHPATPGDSKNKKFNVGVELATAHLRIGALTTDAKPSLEKPDVLGRAGFHAVGFYAWDFKAEKQHGHYSVSVATAETVAAVLKQFLAHFGIDPANVERIRVSKVTAFDEPQGIAVWVDTSTLEGLLSAHFGGADVAEANRNEAALQVERAFGAGTELRPADRIISVTISRNINLDSFPNWSPQTPFAGGIRHSTVNDHLLAELGRAWIDGEYELPQPDKCPLCAGELCLHSLASGQGMLDLIKADESAVAAARNPTAARQLGYAEERGPVTLDGIDISSVFRAASFNETCRRVVLQAGVAIGITLFEDIFRAGLFDADLVIIGGAVPLGRLAEDRKPVPQRETIDGIMQRTLRGQLVDRLPVLRVTRSRFAGLTALLGLTLPV